MLSTLLYCIFILQYINKSNFEGLCCNTLHFFLIFITTTFKSKAGLRTYYCMFNFCAVYFPFSKYTIMYTSSHEYMATLLEYLGCVLVRV